MDYTVNYYYTCEVRSMSGIVLDGADGTCATSTQFSPERIGVAVINLGNTAICCRFSSIRTTLGIYYNVQFQLEPKCSRSWSRSVCCGVCVHVCVCVLRVRGDKVSVHV
jgi:hypothetical protein